MCRNTNDSSSTSWVMINIFSKWISWNITENQQEELQHMTHNLSMAHYSDGHSLVIQDDTKKGMLLPSPHWSWYPSNSAQGLAAGWMWPVAELSFCETSSKTHQILTWKDTQQSLLIVMFDLIKDIFPASPHVTIWYSWSKYLKMNQGMCEQAAGGRRCIKLGSLSSLGSLDTLVATLQSVPRKPWS